MIFHDRGNPGLRSFKNSRFHCLLRLPFATRKNSSATHFDLWGRDPPVGNHWSTLVVVGMEIILEVQAVN